MSKQTSFSQRATLQSAALGTLTIQSASSKDDSDYAVDSATSKLAFPDKAKPLTRDALPLQVNGVGVVTVQ